MQETCLYTMADFMDFYQPESADFLHGQQDPQQNNIEQTATGIKIHYTRVLDIGTRLKAGEQRNKRIVEAAAPLPNGSQLKSRSAYWFVTTEDVMVDFSNQKGFLLKERTPFEYNGQKYYLTQIDFQKNKQGTVRFVFNDEIVLIGCSKSETNRKNIQATGEDMAIDSESQGLINAAMFIDFNGNMNQIQQDYTANNNNNTTQAPAQYYLKRHEDRLLGEFQRNLIWQLNDKLQHRYWELAIRTYFKNITLLESKYPGNEVAALLLYLHKRDGNLKQLYQLLTELEERSSLELIDKSPAKPLFM